VASLNTAWFALIGLLWTGYFLLEGFDFGVGMLSPLIGGDDVDRRLCMNAIGPTWDANEVWLIVAGGATFAAFPEWYETMFSGFYLALFTVLAALIVRGVSMEFRGKRNSARWRATWDAGLAAGSLIPAVVWGAAFTDLIGGLDLSASGVYHGGLLALLSPAAIVGGLASLGMFLAHGAAFLALKTGGQLGERARRAAAWLAVPAAALPAAAAAWLAAGRPDDAGNPGGLPGAVPLALIAACCLAFATSGLLAAARRPGGAFGLSAAGIVTACASVFTALYPRVLVSSGPGSSLTVWNAASGHETLLVMTVVAAIFAPFVLLYQGWSYWVFRQRLTRPAQPAPGRAGPGDGTEPPDGTRPRGHGAPAVPARRETS
jgi:cytochrome d ubiquinol oxidase subunit II